MENDIDLSNLTPAPWERFEEDQAQVFEGERLYRYGVWNINQHPIVCMSPVQSELRGDATDMDFIAIARNAFDGDPDALAWWEANRRRTENVESNK